MDWLKEVEKAAREVLNVLGNGYKEGEYEEALAHELRIRKIPYERQRNFEIFYKGYKVSDGRADLIINPLWCSKGGKETVLELKVGKKIAEPHRRQAQVYMVSLNIDQGAVLSFGDEVLLEKVEKPKKLFDITVVKPNQKTSVNIKNSLQESAEAVFEYFGIEFTYSENAENLFPSAIGVELRLCGIEFSKGSYDILYKCHKVSSYDFDFIFPKREIAKVEFYDKEEKLQDLKEEFEFYVK
ncbi:MAG: GxxExxY protein, partial [candidate division WOR-3 bacterium]